MGERSLAVTKLAIFPVFTLREGTIEAFLDRVRQQRDDSVANLHGALRHAAQ